MRSISNKAGEFEVAITKCEKCGLSGYIFFDQLPKGITLYYNDLWYAKCCNPYNKGEKSARIKGWVPGERAVRLQAIRKRGNSMSEDEAVHGV